ncbi:D-alanyl-D-alanine carboxypeptidase [Azospirillum fermentarium]|uniref:D-alanyl-D-alanine carboxypeptidase family protein n=1 Tax=Azospirillum fermentarium TaxID=1233114 RepID=UPI0022264DF3|nr:D-alanyl-D-alanine carboxypeptidase [Azospirillum fermentarium]MCW2247363.1 D-alanyl-D-alanine carboxypeptidase [Azospirillum fermentarium]
MTESQRAASAADAAMIRAGQGTTMDRDVAPSGVSLPIRLRRGMAGVLAVAAGLLTAAPALAVKYEAIVMDARTGEVLHQENADVITHPASLTKMMTLYLTFEALEAGRLNLEQTLPVSEHAQSMSPTKLGLRAGSSIKVETAILGLVTKSANDAAVVLGEAIGGSEPRFAEIMTRKARQLGMRSTVFRNASGLPDDQQVTTARDFAMLSRALLADYPKYYPYFSRRSFVYGGRSVPNHNRLMSRYDGMDGIKTGYIKASGFNLAASAVRDGRRLVAVVMGGKSPVARDNRMAELLDASFSKLRRGGGDAPVLARADADDAPARAVPVAAAATAAPKAAAKAARAANAWGIQVGAFGSAAAGEKAAKEVMRKHPQLLANTKPSVVSSTTKGKKVYRARLIGLDEKEARNACAKLKKAGGHCMPLAPSL